MACQGYLPEELQKRRAEEPPGVCCASHQRTVIKDQPAIQPLAPFISCLLFISFILWFLLSSICPYATIFYRSLSLSHISNLFFMSTANWCILSGDRFLNSPRSGHCQALYTAILDVPIWQNSFLSVTPPFSPRFEWVFCVMGWKTSMELPLI